MVQGGVSRWHQREPEAFEALRSAIRRRYPTLRWSADAFGERLCGTLPIRDEELLVATYRIKVQLLAQFPNALPAIYETDGRIPRTTDRHVNEKDGTLCIILPERYWVSHEECDLIEYLDGPVRDFFLSQLYFERFNTWPFGEQRHGSAGLLDFYEEIFGTREVTIIEALLGSLSAPRMQRQWMCPCGSKRKLRKCHGPQLRRFRETAASGFAGPALEQLAAFHR